MIKIKHSQSADTRSAQKLVSKKELLEISMQHISDVREGMRWMAGKLMESAETHDWTKLARIDSFHRDFELIQKGSTEDFKEMDWYKKWHLKERHHLNDRCPDDVNLFDVLERIADITMAGMARTGKIYDETLSPEILAKAYGNTIKMLKNDVKVEG